jgi:hypothetical protein
MSFATTLDVAIAAEEARLAELDRLSEAARGRLVELRAACEQAAPEVDAERATWPGVGWSAEHKVALFAGLFRRLEDVFPLRWKNLRKGRSGWALVARTSGFEGYAPSRA